MCDMSIAAADALRPGPGSAGGELEPPTTTTLDSLPDDVISHIASFLGHNDYVSVCVWLRPAPSPSSSSSPSPLLPLG